MQVRQSLNGIGEGLVDLRIGSDAVVDVIPRYRGKRPSLFAPPLLLVGEDAAEYDELHAAIRAAVNPIDTVYEMFVADVVALESKPNS